MINVTPRSIKTVLSAIGLLFLTGCTSMAPSYFPDIDGIDAKKQLPLKGMAANKFSLSNMNVNKVTLRANTMKSPYGDSYADYLRQALVEELRVSGFFDKNSDIVITGTLKVNNVDASGISEGEAKLTAEFKVTDSGVEIYNKSHSIHHTWESSFLGGVAISAAVNNYPLAMQKLVNSFLNDAELHQALKQ
ncbi:MAG: hypothetical protein HRT35_04805 [Algicola sp.]|nr:hypothetical protein [Algicola sp.]